MLSVVAHRLERVRHCSMVWRAWEREVNHFFVPTKKQSDSRVIT